MYLYISFQKLHNIEPAEYVMVCSCWLLIMAVYFVTYVDCKNSITATPHY